MVPEALIRQQDYIGIVDRALAFTPAERKQELEALCQADSAGLTRGDDEWNALAVAKVACCRSYSDLRRFPALWQRQRTVLHTLVTPRYSSLHDALVYYFSQCTPDYVDRVAQESLGSQYTVIDFRLLWRCWQLDCATFDASLFAHALFNVAMFERSVNGELAFLRQNPQVVEKVIIPFWQHDVPVLLRSKWQKGDGQTYCGISTEFWDEVLTHLYAENRLDRQLLVGLLTSLTLPFKKGRLDWHIRLIKMFAPSEQEWLNYQDLLLAALHAGNNTVVNFAIQTLTKISDSPQFDHAYFMQALPAIGGREKCDASILTALKTAETLAERFAEYRPMLAENVSSALIQGNEKIQLCAARLMLKYCSPAEVPMLVEPWRARLKSSVAALLQSEAPVQVEAEIPELAYIAVEAPQSWEALLFHCGKMLEGQDVLDIELFYAGVIARQNDIPADFPKQMQPHYKKLINRYLPSSLLNSLRNFLHQWLTGEAESKPEEYEIGFPHLQRQNQLVLDRLRDGCTLPLLATPTHTPFYVSPQALVARLLAHEQCAYPVDIDDLIVACNRLLPGDIAPKVKQLALTLNGDYAAAIRYLLGASDDIAPQNDDLLPLWTQITRTRDAGGIYPQLAFAAKAQASWPAVCEPFYSNYRVWVDKGESWTWYRLELANREGSTGRRSQSQHYPEQYYYCSLNREYIYSAVDVRYALSLIPHYTDVFLQCCVPDTASGNEVAEIENCLYPLKYLLENQLPMHHGGWVYIAVCLLFEKKTSRSLAAEYIQLAARKGFLNSAYLSDCLAYLVMHKFAPVNRFIEFLDNYHGDPEMQSLQKQILKVCIENREGNPLPTNYKKLQAYYNDFNSEVSDE